MKNIIFNIIPILILTFCSCNINKTSKLNSPNKLISVKVFTENGKTFYNVNFNNKLVMEKSQLGIIMQDANFSDNLTLINSSDIIMVEDEYHMLYGKKKKCKYIGNKKIYHFKNEVGNKMDVVFQVSNDGIGFKYLFPGSSDDLKLINEEKTSFHFIEGTKAWMQPCAEAKSGWSRTNPSYEENYYQEIETGTSAPGDAGWVFPALFKYKDAWIVISETGLGPDYCGSRLKKESPDNEYKIRFPQKTEVSHSGELYPQSNLPWSTPWRIIGIGNLKTLIESTLGTDLAIPAINGDFAFVKPGHSSWSWVLLKDDSTIYSVQKKFIDYAADMSWEYCLVDADWDKKIGYDKIQKLINYSKTKNVGILLWYNSAGDWNDTPYTPKNLLVNHNSRMNEFKKIKRMGVAGVKIDFFGGDGQSVIKYYHNILQDAAKVGLMVNFHGCTLPRGWSRTYPNLVNMESVKGMEFLTFDQHNADVAPNHNCMLPFTRNIYEPMDYTPVCFSEIPGKIRHTTQAHELATAVLFLAGIQHYAEIPKGMKKVPDYVKQIMKEIPVSWDETKFINGYPGKEVIIARRYGDTWYIAGINGEEKEKNITIKLLFVQNKNGILINDGNNNRSFTKTDLDLNFSKSITIKMIKNGGFLIQI